MVLYALGWWITHVRNQMKLQQLLESATGVPINTIEDAVALIKQDCAKFIEESDGNPLYRGGVAYHAESKPLVITKVVRMDREPSATSKHYTEVVDRCLEPIAGFKPRTQAMFTVGSSSTASCYGNVWMVFPVGDYKYIHSKYIFDLYMDLFDRDDFGVNKAEVFNIFEQIVIDTVPIDDLDEDSKDDLYDAMSAKSISHAFFVLDTTKYWKPVLEKLMLYPGMFQTDALPEAIKRGNEIMFHCEKYHALNLTRIESEFGMSGSEFLELLR